MLLLITARKKKKNRRRGKEGKRWHRLGAEELLREPVDVLLAAEAREQGHNVSVGEGRGGAREVDGVAQYRA